MRTSVLLALALLFAACGPSSSHQGTGDCNDPNNLKVDPNNCGTCMNKCDSTQTCSDGVCVAASCNPGETRACYDGAPSTEGVGPCVGGQQTCTNEGYWGICMGEVTPTGETCGDSIDNNCNGMVDEDTDSDGDGFTTCGGDCCDSITDGCSDPKLVNPGAFDAPGNNLDDDCDGMKDNVAANCDTGIASNTGNAMDFGKAIDICQTATTGDKKWGLISASWSLTNGSGTPDAQGHSVRPKFGQNVLPKGGSALALLSTGVAAGKGDNSPKYAGDGAVSTSHSGGTSPFPNDFLNAPPNNGTLPNAPGCPEPDGNTAEDPEMLTLKIRTPTNAKSFSMNVNFFSYEYPEYTCSFYNDFFVVLLDSSYSGQPANPTDKNLAFYQDANMKKYPVGVNLAYGDTGLFTQCVNGQTGCAGLGVSWPEGTISTCKAVTDLSQTGFDYPEGGECDTNSLAGGGTGWLLTAGNVKGGEVMTLRIAIWDTSDTNLDSSVVIDNFQWSVDTANPGTIVVN
ncbi:MAG TPA: choice-of-anchor L domain-containing protein [Kofleriaceae bacterium]|jgi:hypothetical protein|nr:choice-of-anchor L domain-containing protein [Kofleriaceae bacterium]